MKITLPSLTPEESIVLLRKAIVCQQLYDLGVVVSNSMMTGSLNSLLSFLDQVRQDRLNQHYENIFDDSLPDSFDDQKLGTL